MSNGSVELSIQYDDMTGHIWIGERVEGESTNLVDTSADNWLILYLELEGGEGITINLSAHDVENEETKRAFYSKLRVHLNWNDVLQLRDFLDMAIKFRDAEQ